MPVLAGGRGQSVVAVAPERDGRPNVDPVVHCSLVRILPPTRYRLQGGPAVRAPSPSGPSVRGSRRIYIYRQRHRSMVAAAVHMHGVGAGRTGRRWPWCASPPVHPRVRGEDPSVFRASRSVPVCGAAPRALGRGVVAHQLCLIGRVVTPRLCCLKGNVHRNPRDSSGCASSNERKPLARLQDGIRYLARPKRYGRVLVWATPAFWKFWPPQKIGFPSAIAWRHQKPDLGGPSRGDPIPPV